MKCKVMNEMLPRITEHWNSKMGEEVIAAAEHRLVELISENKTDPKAVRRHTELNIYPCISLYEALQQNGISKEEALSFMDRSWSERARPGAESTGKLLKVAGLYKLYPAMFRSVARSQYGTAAGFQMKFHDCGRQRCKFDMTKCLFLDTCSRYGCPELTQCFCHVDDVNNENLHPRLCWNRTQFMGGGGSFCDFDIFVTAKEDSSK